MGTRPRTIALAPDYEAASAVDVYDTVIAHAGAGFVHGIRTGNWTTFVDAFSELQTAARTALAATHRAGAAR